VIQIIEKRKTKVVIFSVIFLFGVIFSLGGTVFGRISIDENGLSFISKDFNDKNEGRTLSEEIEWRFGASTRIGTGFISLYNEGQGSGINPIRNSFLGVLPRSIDENKPRFESINEYLCIIGLDFFETLKKIDNAQKKY
jgi:hypothetical protein